MRACAPDGAAVALAFEAQVCADGVPFDAGGVHGDELVDVVMTASRVLGPRQAQWN
jgi:hypothetical protein